MCTYLSQCRSYSSKKRVLSDPLYPHQQQKGDTLEYATRAPRHGWNYIYWNYNLRCLDSCRKHVNFLALHIRTRFRARWSSKVHNVRWTIRGISDYWKFDWFYCTVTYNGYMPFLWRLQIVYISSVDGEDFISGLVMQESNSWDLK